MLDGIITNIETFMRSHVLDMVIYLCMLVLLVYAFIKCFSPVLRNTRALKRATRVMRGEKKQQLTRPSWNDLHFLGKGLENEWAAFLQNAELMDLYGDSCDVEEYINEDTAIYNAANTPLAELVPGVFVSLGILGTFLGIVIGLSGMDSMAESSQVYNAILTLIGGMQTAFLTSICGIIASIFFNFTNRYVLSRAQRALAKFIDVFQRYGMPKPPSTENKLLAIEQQQNDYMRAFVEEVSQRTAHQMEQAILRAIVPMQRSLDNFLTATTQQQLEGVDRIVHRFIERMDRSLGGQLQHLGETMEHLTEDQARMHAQLLQSYEAVSTITQDVGTAHQQAGELMAQYQRFAGMMTEAVAQNGEDSRNTQELLEQMNNASQQQSRYLAKLQEYQASLQGSMQQYVTWMDQFLTNAQQNNQAAADAMAQSAGHIQDSATLLDSSYHSFVDQIQEGLARALGLMDETVSNAAKQLSSSVVLIQDAVAGVPDMLSSSSRRYSGQVDQFVEALTKMQRSITQLTDALSKHTGEV